MQLLIINPFDKGHRSRQFVARFDPRE
jgi:hypothetical protein